MACNKRYIKRPCHTQQELLPTHFFTLSNWWILCCNLRHQFITTDDARAHTHTQKKKRTHFYTSCPWHIPGQLCHLTATCRVVLPGALRVRTTRQRRRDTLPLGSAAIRKTDTLQFKHTPATLVFVQWDFMTIILDFVTSACNKTNQPYSLTTFTCVYCVHVKRLAHKTTISAISKKRP